MCLANIQVVKRCTRATITLHDPKKRKYYSVENVLVEIDFTPDDSHDHHVFPRIRRQNTADENKDRCDSKIGFCVKRKLARTVYGDIYKGFVVKRRRHQTTMTNKGALDVIREDDELLDSTHSMSYDDDENFIWEPTHEYVIIKTASWEKIRRMRGKHLEDPLKEIQAIQLLRGSSRLGDSHPHVIHGLAALQDDNYLYNITPYCKDGTLGDVVMEDIKAHSRMSEGKAKHWFRQILLAMHQLQQKGVCHRDICLDNFVIKDDTCKLIDFGLALRVPYEHPSNIMGVTDVSDGTARLLMTAQGECGDYTFMSPEVVKREYCFDGFAIDLWGVGVILYIMLIGHKPFKWAHQSDEQFLRLAVNGTLKEDLAYWKIKLSKEAVDLLQNMLWLNTSERLTLFEIMQHPWLTSEECANENESHSQATRKKEVSSFWPLRRR